MKRLNLLTLINPTKVVLGILIGMTALISTSHAADTILSLSRNDSYNTTIVSPYLTGVDIMKVTLENNKNVITSRINVYVDDEVPGCTNGVLLNTLISNVRLFNLGTEVGNVTGYTTHSNGSCVYAIPRVTSLLSGSNNISIQIDTITGAFIIDRKLSFSMDNTSFPGLQYQSDPVTSGEIVGNAQNLGISFVNPGLSQIVMINPQSPQYEYDNGMFTGLSFTITNDDDYDVILSGFSIEEVGQYAQGGSVIPVATTIMMVDDAGVVIASGDSDSYGSVVFENLHITMLSGESKTYHITIQYTGDLVNHTLRYAVSNREVYHENHAYPYSVTVAGNQISVRELTLEMTGTSVSTNAILLPGLTGLTIGGFNITASDAPISLESLVLVNLSADWSGNNITNGSISGSINTGADGIRVDLYQANTLIGTGILSGGVVMIPIPSPSILTLGSTMPLTIKVTTYNFVIHSEEDTNQVLRLGVLSPGSIISGAQTLITSPESIKPATGDFGVIFNNHYIRNSLITMISQANPDQSNSNLLSIAGTNDATIFSVEINAASQHDASIKTLVFNHTGAGVSTSNYRIKLDNIILTETGAVCLGGNANVVCVFTGDNDEGYKISAGSTIDLQLIADVSASVTSNDYMITTLTKGAADDYGIYNVTNAFATPTHLIWSDNAASPLTKDSIDRYTDAGVQFPINHWLFERDGTPIIVIPDPVVITNITYTFDSGANYVFDWTTSDASYVQISSKSLSGLDPYMLISTSQSGISQSTPIFFSQSGDYMIKLTPVDLSGTAIGQDIFISITTQSPSCINGANDYPTCAPIVIPVETGAQTSGIMTVIGLVPSSLITITGQSINHLAVMELMLSDSMTGGVISSINFHLSGSVDPSHVVVYIESSTGYSISNRVMFDTNQGAQLTLTSGYDISMSGGMMRIILDISGSVNKSMDVSILTTGSINSNHLAQGIFPMVSSVVTMATMITPPAICTNGANDYPTCTPIVITPPAVCANGANDYPTCTPIVVNPPAAEASRLIHGGGGGGYARSQYNSTTLVNTSQSTGSQSSGSLTNSETSPAVNPTTSGVTGSTVSVKPSTKPTSQTLSGNVTSTKSDTIITISIAKDGSIIIARSQRRTTLDQSNGPMLVKNIDRSNTATVIQVQSANKTTKLKPYWIITPAMLQDISIIRNGYQPTRDIAPYKKVIKLDPRLRK